MEKNVFKKNGLSFELDYTNLTATVIKSPEARGDIFLERTIKYKSQDYEIRKIGDKAFYNNITIRSLSFSKDSAIISIGKKAFYNSYLQSLTIPPKLEILDEDWCLCTQQLTTIYLMEGNKYFKYLNSQTKSIIVGKSNSNDEKFDVLVFACRNIKEITIPSNIREIGNCCFDCSKLRKIKFEENSSLEKIRKNAFSSMNNLKQIDIPPSVKELEDEWIKRVYYNDIIVSISPENKNYKNTNDGIIVGKSHQNCDEFDVIVLAKFSIEKVVISSSIKYINSYAFCGCNNLNTVEFQPDSKLVSIGKMAFEFTQIKEINIPSSCQKIRKEAFASSKLERIEIPFDCKIEKFSFGFISNTNIEKLNIPNNLKILKSGWCDFTDNLTEIIISPENPNFAYLDDEHKIVVGKSDSDAFDVILFACRDITKIFIPSTIKIIESDAFTACKYLTTVEFSKDSKLESIGKDAFSFIPITSIDIPSSVTEILSSCFELCFDLSTINIPEDSQLITIGEKSFFQSGIKKVFIPPKITDFPFDLLDDILISSDNHHFKYLDKEKKIIVGKNYETSNDEFDTIFYVKKDIKHAFIPANIKHIAKYAFSNCKDLEKVEFENNSQLISIGEYAFSSISFDQMTIPSHVKYIDHMSFCGSNIKKIDFEQNSEMTFFSFLSFNQAGFECFSFPSNLKKLEKNWCLNVVNLKNIYLPPENHNFSYSDDTHKMILTKSNENSTVFDVVAFVCRDCKDIEIPPTITKISSSSFSNSKVQKIFIPKNVKEIENLAFNKCENVKSIEFEKDSNLESLESSVFGLPLIKCITFPRKIKYFYFDMLGDTTNLRSIEFLCDEMSLDPNFSINFLVISFPNAHSIKILKNTSFHYNEFLMFAYPNAKIIK